MVDEAARVPALAAQGTRFDGVWSPGTHTPEHAPEMLCANALLAGRPRSWGRSATSKRLG